MINDVIDIYTCNPEKFPIGYSDFVCNKNGIGGQYCEVVDIIENSEKIGTDRDKYTHIIKFKVLFD